MKSIDMMELLDALAGASGAEKESEGESEGEEMVCPGCGAPCDAKGKYKYGEEEESDESEEGEEGEEESEEGSKMTPKKKMIIIALLKKKHGKKGAEG
jgi:hypothetical protein